MRIDDKKKKLKELLDYVRGDYNLFYALGISRKENYHSRMIADLLNPNGHHQLGACPLNEFCTIVGIDPLKTEKLYIKTEKYTDANRRMDIYVKDNVSGRVVIIENKIDAKDQAFQLRDYYNNETNTTDTDNIKLFYLTLKGIEPSEGSRGELESGKEFTLLSYKQIYEWLNNILEEHKECNNLLQYKNIVEYLVDDKLILKINAAIYEKEDGDYGGGVAEYLSKRLTEKLINRFKAELGDAACSMPNKGLVTINKEHVTIKIQSNFWCCYGDKCFFLQEKLPNNPLATFWNTTSTKQIEKIAELPPSDLELLLSDDVNSTINFEQIVDVLQ